MSYISWYIIHYICINTYTHTHTHKQQQIHQTQLHESFSFLLYYITITYQSHLHSSLHLDETSAGAYSYVLHFWCPLHLLHINDNGLCVEVERGAKKCNNHITLSITSLSAPLLISDTTISSRPLLDAAINIVLSSAPCRGECHILLVQSATNNSTHQIRSAIYCN